MRKYQNNKTSFSGRLPFHKDLGSFYFEDLERIFPNKEMLCRSLGCFHSKPTRDSPRRPCHTTGKFACLFLANHVTEYFFFKTL